MNSKTYVEEQEKIKKFRCEVKDAIDELSQVVMDKAQKELEAVLPRIKEIVTKEAVAALKAFVATAPFDDPDLKAALERVLDGLPDVVAAYITAGMRRAVKKAFEMTKSDIDDETNTALEGLDLLADDE
jgi:hypothetical protein